MKMKFTIYHLTNMVDDFLKSKRSLNKMFKDISTAWGVPVENLEALRETRKSDETLPPEFAWSIELNEENVGKINNMPFLSKVDFYKSVPGQFLNDFAKFTGADTVSSFRENVLNYAIETDFKGVDEDVFLRALKVQMDDKFREEMPALTALLKVGNENPIAKNIIEKLCEGNYLVAKIEKKYLSIEDSYPDFLPALNNSRNFLEKNASPCRVRVMLGEKFVSEFNDEKLEYELATNRVNSLSVLQNHRNDFKSFDFVESVKDIVANNQIDNLVVKFNRKLTEDEKSFFVEVVQNVVLDFMISDEDITQALQAGALKLRVDKAMNIVGKQQEDDFKNQFKL